MDRNRIGKAEVVAFSVASLHHFFGSHRNSARAHCRKLVFRDLLALFALRPTPALLHDDDHGIYGLSFVMAAFNSLLLALGDASNRVSLRNVWPPC